jgi:Flp pilus assembly pilin Flp
MLVFLSDLPINIGTKLAGVASEFGDVVSGAEIVEHAVMIALITAAAVTAILAVGSWVASEWKVLSTLLAPRSPSPADKQRPAAEHAIDHNPRRGP